MTDLLAEEEIAEERILREQTCAEEPETLRRDLPCMLDGPDLLANAAVNHAGTNPQKNLKSRMKWEDLPKSAGPLLFAVTTVTALRSWTDKELNDQGRVTFPMVYDRVLDRYVAIEWEAAYNKISNELCALEHASAARFYGGHGLSGTGDAQLRRFAAMFGAEWVFGSRLPGSSRSSERETGAESSSLNLTRSMGGNPCAKAVLDFGGNVLGEQSNAEADFTYANSCSLVVHIGTTLSRSHLATGDVTFLLPCLKAGEMRASDLNSGFTMPPEGMLEFAPTIIEAIARKTLSCRHGIDWDNSISIPDYTEGGPLVVSLTHPEKPLDREPGGSEVQAQRVGDRPQPYGALSVGTLQPRRSAQA